MSLHDEASAFPEQDGAHREPGGVEALRQRLIECALGIELSREGIRQIVEHRQGGSLERRAAREARPKR